MTQPVRPEDMRASDAERELVQQWLHRAHADGSLDLAEFDARVVRTWEAKTRGELAALTIDLPNVAHASAQSPTPVVPPPLLPTPLLPAPKPVKTGGGRKALKVLGTIWLSVSVLNFALWLLVSLLGGEGLVHPWFLWVAVPPGAVLGVLWWSTDPQR
ncbi:DUF1707 SHOCT-like domain-containing protein [Saccharothrix luteola]|uniref:DUF1707 SHOCT-like domain-containing protein n=1 Tax=Saccharothrix luteola TaxID=2893018 RepID=UPI001E55DD44|nr:DUF1707 domain-containing protein [Saccharothrix luteola]MCC8244468.1 DUF1707 domain-containing protein [Saccharothrix luteola]